MGVLRLSKQLRPLVTRVLKGEICIVIINQNHMYLLELEMGGHASYEYILCHSREVCVSSRTLDSHVYPPHFEIIYML